jgi:branched-chain amino acid transport system ATP-binding protein
MSVALDIVNLTKRYGAMAAVKDLSFQVRQDEILGIAGPNGAGKTTLFDVISGLAAPSEGRIALFGEDITACRADEDLPPWPCPDLPAERGLRLDDG